MDKSNQSWGNKFNQPGCSCVQSNESLQDVGLRVGRSGTGRRGWSCVSGLEKNLEARGTENFFKAGPFWDKVLGQKSF